MNAFSSDDFIKWVESKLDEHGVKKVVPDGEGQLEEAYFRAVKVAVVNKAIRAAVDQADGIAANCEMPSDLADTIREQLAKNPTRAWDEVVADMATLEV